MTITRLWQNTSKVHFDKTARPDGRLLVYGGHVISLARALSFNGLANAQCDRRDQRRQPRQPLLRRRHDQRLVRSARHGRDRRRRARARCACGWSPRTPGAHGFALRGADGKHLPHVLLDLDYWALVPR